MAAKKKKRPAPRRRKKQAGGGFLQRVLVGVAGIVLVLCAASVTQGFFFRNGTERPVDDLFRIEVLNGTGKGGLAHAVKRGLLRKGIDVIEAGNAPSFDYAESVLIARKPGADVETLGQILGCANIISQHKDKSLADATLILGDDYRELNLDWQLESDLLD